MIRIRSNEIVNAVMALSEEEKAILRILARQDTEIFITMLKKIMRIKDAIHAGNKLIWEKIKKEDSQTIDYFLRELEDEKRIGILQNKLVS